ncbi:hypothetical protein F4678DRAFT_471691 [Xylaria arbuscula]|nr:hypothetical protein F4678DRAFT_471691 [Xylaria arbuscula]
MRLARKVTALYEGMKLIRGLDLSDKKFYQPEDVYKAFVSATDQDVLPVNQIHEQFASQLAHLLGACLDHTDFTLVHATWDSLHLLLPQSIEQVVDLVVDARRRWFHSRRAASHEVDSVIEPLDKLIGIMDQPPTYFGQLDLTVLGEKRVREKLYGIDRDFTAEELIKPEYPHNQSDPINARLYLSWLALTTQDEKKSKSSLFLTPVAFMDHEEQQAWYQTTGHKSRYYATIDDFIEYATHQIGFIPGQSGDIPSYLKTKNHVLALMTPWFFDIDEVESSSKLHSMSVQAMWEKRCVRSGMAFLLSKRKPHKTRYNYRLVIFRPGPPIYPYAAERGERGERQNEWLREVISLLRRSFDVPDIWPPGPRRLGADSVEASAEFITEMMENFEEIPDKDIEIADRGFNYIDDEGYIGETVSLHPIQATT